MLLGLELIGAGTTCKKILCYMRDSAGRWLTVENAKTFRGENFDNFEFSHVKEIVEFLLEKCDSYNR